MDARASALRRAVGELDRQCVTEPFPVHIRAAVVRYACSRRPGTSWAALGEALGLAGSTVQRWCADAPTATSEDTALVPVVVGPSVEPAAALVLVSPRGFRLEGLALDDALLLLDRLS